MIEDLIGTGEAAKIAGRHPRTVVAWIHKGMLPALKMPGGRGPYLIKKEDLRDLLDTLYTPLPYTPEAKDANEQAEV